MDYCFFTAGTGGLKAMTEYFAQEGSGEVLIRHCVFHRGFMLRLYTLPSCLVADGSRVAWGGVI